MAGRVGGTPPTQRPGIALGDPRAPVRNGESAGGRARLGGIVGVNGRWNFGAENYWLELYHPQFGSGESDFARQEMASIGYARKRWGVVASCRSLEYDIGTGRPFSSPSPNGP